MQIKMLVSWFDSHAWYARQHWVPILKVLCLHYECLRSPFWMLEVPILNIWGPHFEYLRSPLKLRTVFGYLSSTSLASLSPMSNWLLTPLKVASRVLQEILIIAILSAGWLFSLSTFKLVSFTACASWSLRACFCYFHQFSTQNFRKRITLSNI